jgi:hypothetical protein
LNKDHYIVKINNELDELFFDGAEAVIDYVNSNFAEIDDYIGKHPEETVLGLILMDRILWMLPRFEMVMRDTLAHLPSRVNSNMSDYDIDDIIRRVNTAGAFAKKLKCVREAVRQYKQMLEKRFNGNYKSKEEHNPFSSLKENNKLIY